MKTVSSFRESILKYDSENTDSIYYPIVRDKDFKIISVAGFELGKTYEYFNQGLGEVKNHFIIRFEIPYAVAGDGKVSIEGLINQRDKQLRK